MMKIAAFSSASKQIHCTRASGIQGDARIRMHSEPMHRSQRNPKMGFWTTNSPWQFQDVPHPAPFEAFAPGGPRGRRESWTRCPPALNGSPIGASEDLWTPKIGHGLDFPGDGWGEKAVGTFLGLGSWGGFFLEQSWGWVEKAGTWLGLLRIAFFLAGTVLGWGCSWNCWILQLILPLMGLILQLRCHEIGLLLQQLGLD